MIAFSWCSQLLISPRFVALSSSDGGDLDKAGHLARNLRSKVGLAARVRRRHPPNCASRKSSAAAPSQAENPAGRMPERRRRSALRQDARLQTERLRQRRQIARPSRDRKPVLPPTIARAQDRSPPRAGPRQIADRLSSPTPGWNDCRIRRASASFMRGFSSLVRRQARRRPRARGAVVPSRARCATSRCRSGISSVSAISL